MVRRKVGSNKNYIKLKMTSRTNIIATNFLWEQLITSSALSKFLFRYIALAAHVEPFAKIIQFKM